MSTVQGLGINSCLPVTVCIVYTGLCCLLKRAAKPLHLGWSSQDTLRLACALQSTPSQHVRMFVSLCKQTCLQGRTSLQARQLQSSTSCALNQPKVFSLASGGRRAQGANRERARRPANLAKALHSLSVIFYAWHSLYGVFPSTAVHLQPMSTVLCT